MTCISDHSGLIGFAWQQATVQSESESDVSTLPNLCQLRQGAECGGYAAFGFWANLVLDAGG